MYLLLALLSASPLSSFLQEAVKRGDVAGVVALVVAGDRVVYHKAFGKQDVGRDIAMRGDSIFYIASMTKPITSVAAMMLADEGKIALDDRVDKYLPDFHPQVITNVDLAKATYSFRDPVRPVTVRHLMTHMSGIGYDWSDSRLAMVEMKSGSSLATLLHDPESGGRMARALQSWGKSSRRFRGSRWTHSSRAASSGPLACATPGSPCRPGSGTASSPSSRGRTASSSRSRCPPSSPASRAAMAGCTLRRRTTERSCAPCSMEVS